MRFTILAPSEIINMLITQTGHIPNKTLTARCYSYDGHRDSPFIGIDQAMTVANFPCLSK